MKKTKIPILYEDEFIIAVNKPPCMASVPADNFPVSRTLLGIVQRQFENFPNHADRTEDDHVVDHVGIHDDQTVHPYLQPYLLPYLLHRLDYETSGVVLLGKYERDREKLENIFRISSSAGTKKIYVALLKGVPRGHVIDAKLPARHSDLKIKAETHFKVLEVFRVRVARDRNSVVSTSTPCAFVEVEMLTGRKHQIRQHFAGISCPVVLDREYGDFRFNRKFQSLYHLSRQFLHAARIIFSHPMTGKMVEIEAPLSPDLISCVKKIASSG